MAKTVEFIHVACKLPAGLMLQLRNETAENAMSLTDSHEIRQMKLADRRRVLAEFKIEGCSSANFPFVKENEVGITKVPRDLWEQWEAWAKRVKYAPYMKGFVYAFAELVDVNAAAREIVKEKTGLHPLDVHNDMKADTRLKEMAIAGITQVNSNA